MRKILIVTLTAILLLPGCGRIYSETGEAPSGSTETRTPTLEIVSSLTPNPTAMEAPTPRCLNVQGERSLRDVANGTVLLGRWDDGPPYLLNLESGIRYDLTLKTKGNTDFAGLHVSPDGNALGYIEQIRNDAGDLTGQEIWVADSRGRVTAHQAAIPDILTGKWHWLDHGRMQLHSRESTVQDGAVIVADPYHNGWEYLRNSLPGFYIDPFAPMLPYILVDYSPDLQLVAYAGKVETGGNGVIVRDVSRQSTLWQTTRGDYHSQWSPLGTNLAIVDKGRLYRITSDGVTAPVPQPNLANQVGDFAWSPNGKYIAFWTAHPQGAGADLRIYDVAANRLSDDCISADSKFGTISAWSADSQQVLVTLYKAQSGVSRDVTALVDIKKHAAYEIPREMDALDWMNSVP